MKKIIAALFIGIAINNIALADTRIIIETGDSKTDIWLNEKYARTSFIENNSDKNSPDENNPDENDPDENGSELPPGDVIKNFSSGKNYMIIDKKKILLDMSSPPMFFEEMTSDTPKKKSSQKINFTYKNRGSGETIAGLKTTKYEVSAQGRKCFDIWLTKDRIYGQAMKKLGYFSDSEDDDDGSESICEQANADDNEKYGFPVKIIATDAEQDMLVVEFKTNVKAPRKYLSFPAGYKIMTMTEMIQDAMARQLPE
ncbi:MAG TPA: DUF4412 domain-containing protein [Gammaproteobacteria bacterium]|nr:DUF4412 domain-containing protein [Gammaproteobacteria bacterium]